MSCAHFLIDRINVQNRTVLVTGCGPVGLLCIGIAKAYQAKRIIAVDIKESSLVLAQTLGRVVFFGLWPSATVRRCRIIYFNPLNKARILF